MACGFSLDKNNLDLFKEKITAIANKELKSADLRPKIIIDAALDLSELDKEFIRQIEQFAPFGQYNERPIFISKRVMISDIMTMGVDNQHIKLKISGHGVGSLNALGFNQTEKWQHLKISDKIDIVYTVDLNEFNGRTEVQLKIIDIKQI